MILVKWSFELVDGRHKNSMAVALQIIDTKDHSLQQCQCTSRLFFFAKLTMTMLVDGGLPKQRDNSFEKAALTELLWGCNQSAIVSPHLTFWHRFQEAGVLIISTKTFETETLRVQDVLIWDQKEQKWSKFSKRIIQQETFIESVNMIQLLITALYYFALMSDKYKYINRDRQSMGTCICIFKSIVFVSPCVFASQCKWIWTKGRSNGEIVV